MRTTRTAEYRAGPVLIDRARDTNEARDKRIFEMWITCCTQEEIAEAVRWAKMLSIG